LFNEFLGISDKGLTPLHRDFMRFLLSKPLRVWQVAPEQVSVGYRAMARLRFLQ
jgi:hypothetical protein